MFNGALQELKMLSKLPRLTHQQRERARKLMSQLVEGGFTSSEIETITNRRWKKGSIEKYVASVKVKDTAEKDGVIAILRDFDGSRLEWSDVEDFVKIRSELKADNVTFENVVKLIVAVRSQSFNLAEATVLERWVRESQQSIPTLRRLRDELEALKELGYDQPALKNLVVAAQRFGGPEKLLEAISNYDKIIKMEEQLAWLESRLKQLNELIIKDSLEYAKIQVNIQNIQSHYNYALTLIDEYNFDLLALKTFMEMVAKHGDPHTVIEALNKYGRIQSLNQLIAEKQAQTRDLDDKLNRYISDVKSQELLLNEVNQGIGQVQEKYSKSLRLRNIVDLIDDPSRASMQPREFLHLSLLLLTGMRDYGERNSETMGNWKSIAIYLNYVIDEANRVISGRS